MRKQMMNTIGVLVLLVGFPVGLWLWGAFSAPKQGVSGPGAQTALSPLVRLVGSVAKTLSGSLDFVVNAGQVRRYNEALERENTRLAAENDVLRETLAKYERLDAAARRAEMEGWDFVEAEVVAYSSRRWARSLIVDRGAKEGLRVGDPALHMKGLAGVVVRVESGTATVQLLNDPQTAIGVTMLPLRAHGIVRGTGESETLELTLENPSTPIQPGQRVITSGMSNSVYPRGLHIGTVASVGKNRYGQDIGIVEPEAVFGQLEEVLILRLAEEEDVPMPTPNDAPTTGGRSVSETENAP